MTKGVTSIIGLFFSPLSSHNPIRVTKSAAAYSTIKSTPILCMIRAKLMHSLSVSCEQARMFRDAIKHGQQNAKLFLKQFKAKRRQDGQLFLLHLHVIFRQCCLLAFSLPNSVVLSGYAYIRSFAQCPRMKASVSSNSTDFSWIKCCITQEVQ